VKIPPARLEAVCAQPPKDWRIVLVYGPDHGAVGLRAEQIARSVVDPPNDPFRVTLLSSEQVSHVGAELYDAMASMSLGGGRSLIRIRPAEEKIAAAVTRLLQELPATDHLLLLEAGELEKKSKLRQLAESEDQRIAALACYPEEGADRTRLIAGHLRALGHGLEPEALEILTEILPPDRLGVFAELEKISLYVGDKNKITAEQVLAALGDAAAVDLDQMALALGEGNRRDLDVTLERLLVENTAPVAMLRAAQRHFGRLLETRLRIDAGYNLKDSMAKLQPRIFWKSESRFAQQVQRWQAEQLLRVLAQLSETESLCKRTGLPDTTICRQHLLRLRA
jgi:DNA polymerase III subunit delta